MDMLVRYGDNGLSAVEGMINRKQLHELEAVSYTHLDVYKRQAIGRPKFNFRRISHAKIFVPPTEL